MTQSTPMRMRDELDRAEICQANWYLCMRRTLILESKVCGFHFIANPQLGVVWDTCREMAQKGEEWDLNALLGQSFNEELFKRVTDSESWGLPSHNERMILQCFEVHEFERDRKRIEGDFNEGRTLVGDFLTQMKDRMSQIQIYEPDRMLTGNEAANATLNLFRGVSRSMTVPLRFFPGPWVDLPVNHVHIIGSETSGHKTTLAINVALSVASSKDECTGKLMPVTYYTAEDSNDLIIARMSTNLSDNDLMVRKIMSGGYKNNMGTAFRVAKRLGELPIGLMERPRPISEVISMLYRDWAIRGTKCVIIDYLGDIELNEARGAPPEIAQLTSMVKQLDSLAKRCNMAIFIVVQFKHEYSSSADKDGKTRAPTIGDIYGGSRICQKAFSVFLNHVVQRDVEGTSDQRMVTYIRKFKTEGKGQVKLRVDPVHNRIWREDFVEEIAPDVLRLPNRFSRNQRFTPDPPRE